MSFVVRTAADADAKTVREPWGTLTWLASQDLTGCKALTVGRVVIKRGRNNPCHSHPLCQEVLVLLSGKLEHLVGQEWVPLNPGDTLVLDAGVPHYARSVGEVDAEMVVVYDAGRRDFRKEQQ